MKRSLLFTVLILSTLSAFGQQDPQYSGYMFNPFAVNPAYAGTRNSFSAVLLHRSQWVGIQDAPTTQSFAVHAPVNKYKLAWGINMFRDALGPTQNIMAGGTVGYHLKLGESTLAFALRAGIYNSNLNRNQLNFQDPGDQFNIGGQVSTTVPTFDFGMYYYKTKFYAGLNINHMNNTRFDYADYSNDNLFLRTHVFLTGGYVFEFKSRKVMFKPSFLLKITENSPPSLDLNFNFLFFKKLWAGLSFRSQNSIVAILDFNITDYLRLGYAYDYNYTAIGSYSTGSHEIFIGFDFNLKKQKADSPRYL